MMRTFGWGITILAALWTGFLVGCSSDEFKTYPVTGRVVFADGSPLAVGKLYVETRNKKYGLGIGAPGNIREDGTFEIRTYKPGDGAPVGEYVVFIRGAVVGGTVGMRPEDRRPGTPLIHQKYLNAGTTDLKIQIEQGPNDFELVVDRP